MLDQSFYWGTIRKAVIAFGNLFNNISIDRKDSVGNTIQTIKIPLAYASKQKFLARIQQRPNVDERQLQLVIPRMAFEILGMNYDYDRKISPIQQSRTITNSATIQNAQYAPTPYNVSVALYVSVKNQDDGLQIIEQILPYFNPDYNLKLIAIPELAIKNNLPVLLDSVNFEDSYEGSFEDRREIVWTLMFTIKLNFYGPVNRSGVIKKVIASTFNNASMSNVQNTIITQVVPPDANINSYTGFTQTFTDF
jgi:hypothetical protein